jgi:16S rRNA processing protein RimM
VSVPDAVELGTIVGVFGVAGEVRVHLHNPTSDLLREPRTVILVSPSGATRRARVSVRPGAGKRILGRVEGVEDRDAAAALTGTQVWIPIADLPPEEDGDIYVHRLLGAEVRVGDRVVGELLEIHDRGPTPILEISTGGRDSAFVPLIDEFVEALLPLERRVVLREGALEEP